MPAALRFLRWSSSSILVLGFAACGSGDLMLPGPGDPASLTIVAGDGQRATLGQALTDPLIVEVRDGENRPVAGTRVTFRFTDDLPEAAVDPGIAPTDGQGRAAARVQLGRLAGYQAIEAEVASKGPDLRVRFRLTALPADPPPDGGGGGSGTGGNGSGGGGGSGGGNGGGSGGGSGRGGAGGSGGGGAGPAPAPAPDPPSSAGGDGQGGGHGDKPGKAKGGKGKDGKGKDD